MLLQQFYGRQKYQNLYVSGDILVQLARAYKILKNGSNKFILPAKNVAEQMFQAYALPIERVAWMDIFLKIFSTQAAAESTHGSL
uniref:Uncharacterized protein n=1 Tax=Arundo donax TaxID=35708 RepID=A0A0A9H852_ARUDO